LVQYWWQLAGTEPLFLRGSLTNKIQSQVQVRCAGHPQLNKSNQEYTFDPKECKT